MIQRSSEIASAPSSQDASRYASLFSELGYRLIDDAWGTDGRLTYLHEDDATRAYLGATREILARHGWQRDAHALRTFRHEASEQVIEIEPGGDGCSGHYLHHMQAAVIA